MTSPPTRSARPHFRLRDGGRIREQLLSLSDRERSFRYFILEAPVPLRDYVAEHAAAAGDRATATTCCEWRAEFDPPPRERERLMRFVREEIIAAGFAAIRAALAAERAGRPAPRLASATARRGARRGR